MLLFCNLFGFAQSLIFVLQPILLKNTKLEVADLNQTLAVGSALFLIGTPTWLKIKRKVGSCTALIIALCFFAFSHALVGVLIWDELPWLLEIYAPVILLSSRIFYGIGASGIVLVVQARASDIADAEVRLKLLQKISAHLILGRIIGPVIALPLLWIWPPLTILLVLVLSLCVGSSLCKLRKKEHESFGASAQQYKKMRALRPFVTYLRPYLIMAAILQSLVGVVQFIFGIWLMETLQWKAENAAIFTGGLLMSCGVLIALTQLYIKPTAKIFLSVLRILTLTLVLLGLSLFAFRSVFLFSAFNVAVIVTAALWAPTYLHAAIERANGIRNDSITTVVAMTHTIAYSLTGIVSGYLYQWNEHSIFFIAAMMCIVAFYISNQILISFTQSVNT